MRADHELQAPSGSRPDSTHQAHHRLGQVAGRGGRLADAGHAGEEARRELLEQAPDREVEGVDVHRDAAARHQDVRAGEAALLAQRHRRAFVHQVARGQLVAADAGVREQRAGAALDVDPAVGARRAGVGARSRRAASLRSFRYFGERLQARGALLEVDAPAAPARRRCARGDRLAEVDLVGVRVATARPLMALAAPRRRARRPSGRRCSFAGSHEVGMRARLRATVQGWYFQAPFSILTITRARWSRPRWSVGRHVEDAVRAGQLLDLLERVAQRRAELRRAGLRLLQRHRHRGGHQQAGVPGVGAEGRDRALAVGRFVLRRRSRAPTCLHRVARAAAARRPAPGRPAGSVPSTSLPPTRRKSALATPWVW